MRLSFPVRAKKHGGTTRRCGCLIVRIVGFTWTWSSTDRRTRNDLDNFLGRSPEQFSDSYVRGRCPCGVIALCIVKHNNSTPVCSQYGSNSERESTPGFTTAGRKIQNSAARAQPGTPMDKIWIKDRIADIGSTR